MGKLGETLGRKAKGAKHNHVYASQLQGSTLRCLAAGGKYFSFWGDFVGEQAKLIAQWLREWEVGEREQEGPGDRAGGLALVGGELRIKKPEGLGRWPTIAPAADGLVKIFHHGQEIKKPLVLEDVEGISFQLARESAGSSFEIAVSADNMEVWLETKFVWGREYRLVDTDYTEQLVVSAEEYHREEPEQLDWNLVIAKIRDLGIKVPLEESQILSACLKKQSGRKLVGVGIPPKLPVEGSIRLVYDSKDKKRRPERGGRVDPLERSVISSVEPGEVLAFWRPPQEGRPGQDVFGRVVPPPPPKRTRFLTGPGVKLIQGGTVAVAEIAGRPCLEYGRLCVRPQLMIASDVDLSTGNIDFTGDVIIMGDVTESLTVRAGGLVQVKGSVYQARIVAGGNVIVGKNVVGAKISAGGQMSNCVRITALLGRLIPELRRMRKAVFQLREHPRFSTQDLRVHGDGYLVKLALEMHFTQIPKFFARLKELLAAQKQQETDQELDKLVLVMGQVSSRFLGANPLTIKSLAEVDDYLDCLEKAKAYLDEICQTRAHIQAYYCQNSKLKATGDIIVSGPLAYGCEMTSGSVIKMNGSCRGGTYFAASSLVVNSAGLNETVKTSLAVGEGGSICATTFNPGVRIAIGAAQMSLNKERQHLKLQFEEGRWIEQFWKGEV